MDWLVKKSNKDTELFHLNKILQSIKGFVEAIDWANLLNRPQNLVDLGTAGYDPLQSVRAGTGTSVDTADPINPAVSLSVGAQASLALADSSVQPGDLATVATTGNYNDLSGAPTIPAQFNPIAGADITLTGTYPNITFAVSDTLVTGVLPVVTSEISSGQPVFVIAEDGSLIYLPVGS